MGRDELIERKSRVLAPASALSQSYCSYGTAKKCCCCCCLCVYQAERTAVHSYLLPLWPFGNWPLWLLLLQMSRWCFTLANTLRLGVLFVKRQTQLRISQWVQLSVCVHTFAAAVDDAVTGWTGAQTVPLRLCSNQLPRWTTQTAKWRQCLVTAAVLLLFWYYTHF